jgi:hypothetical protein
MNGRHTATLLVGALTVLWATRPVRAASRTERLSPSCVATPAARQLDYWVGQWIVAPPGSAGTGHSTVTLSLDKCLLTERWRSDASDHNGENALAYSAEDDAWHGLFVDNHGRVHAFTGTATPGVAELRGPSRDAQGAAVLNRLRMARVSADTIEQTWEKSIDRGATWATEYRMRYVRMRSIR